MKVVVIPATYNEKGNIERLIKILEEEVFPVIENHEMHILVADDNSPDGTGDIVKKLMKKWKNLQLNSGDKKGLGAAYLRAMTYAIEKMNADIVFEIDADLSHDPRDIPRFLKKMDGGYDMVVGTRYSDGGSMPDNWPILRKAYSIIGNLLVRTITFRFKYHDWTGGFRAIKKQLFLKERNKLSAFQGYTFQVAFLYKSLIDGYKIGEVPIHFSDRTLGRSKIAPGTYIVDLLKYVIYERLKELLSGKFGKFLAVGSSGFIINAVILRVLVQFYNMTPEPANLIGAGVAIFTNFNLNNFWTFKEEKLTKFSTYLWKLLHYYVTTAFGVVVIQTGTILVGDSLFGKQWYFLFFLIGTFLLLVWNFVIYSLVIWRKKPQ